MSTPANSINEPTTGVVGMTGTGFTATPLTQYLVNLGHANSYQIDQVNGTGTTGQVLTSNGAGAEPTWQDAGGGLDTDTILGKVIDWDDFITGNTVLSNTQSQKLGWSGTNLQANFSGLTAYVPVSGHPGVAVFDTNAVENSFLTMISGQQNFVLGGGVATFTFVLRVLTLSDASNNFSLCFGLGNTSDATLSSDSVNFFYNHATNSGNWTINCRSGGASTTGNTNSTLDTNWHRYQIVVNAGKTSVAFYIDGTEVTNSPLATNIPSVAISPCVFIARTVGTAVRQTYLDLYMHEIDLTTPR